MVLEADANPQTEKRDTLRAIEKKYQKLWADQKIYESNAPTLEEYPKSTSIDEIRAKHPKFFGTMAYPYGKPVSPLLDLDHTDFML